MNENNNNYNDEKPTLENVIEMAQEKISLGENLINQLKPFEDSVDGIKKIQRKINQELKFLKKAIDKETICLNNIICSNLLYFNYLVECIQQCDNITYVDYPLPALEERDVPLRIDIICENGATWIKVIARNPKSLSDAVYGRTNYGSKNILEQAKMYINLAKNNEFFYKIPKIIFKFVNNLDDDLYQMLIDIGIHIEYINNIENNKGVEQSFPELLTVQNHNELLLLKNDIKILNLDITTLIAYVSEMTNGSCYWIYKEKLLTEQASWERCRPVKPILEKLFQGKELICCETAIKSFTEIVELLGGHNEKERAKDLLKIIKILPDNLLIKKNENNNDRECDDLLMQSLKRIKICGKIKARSFQIFSFGLLNKALTVTSNEGFLRAAKMQGLNIPAYLHEARALTELKEQTAEKLIL